MSEWWSYVGGKVFFPVSLTGGGEPPRFPARARRSVTVAEPVAFETDEAMAAASDLVVHGRVVAVGPGPETGTADGGRFWLRTVTLDPIEITRGSVETDLVRFDEPGYTAEGGFLVNDVAWSEKGEEGWYFLVRGPDGRYRPICSRGKRTLR